MVIILVISEKWVLSVTAGFPIVLGLVTPVSCGVSYLLLQQRRDTYSRLAIHLEYAGSRFADHPSHQGDVVDGAG